MLNAKEVEKTFLDCLYSKEEAQDKESLKKAVTAEGIMNTFGFNPVKLEKNKEEIISYLNELDDRFREGWSFLNMAFDKEGHQWGEHPNCEQLMCLGMAIGKIEYLMPREMWNLFPSGVPYIILK